MYFPILPFFLLLFSLMMIWCFFGAVDGLNCSSNDINELNPVALLAIPSLTLFGVNAYIFIVVGCSFFLLRNTYLYYFLISNQWIQPLKGASLSNRTRHTRWSGWWYHCNVFSYIPPWSIIKINILVIFASYVRCKYLSCVFYAVC